MTSNEVPDFVNELIAAGCEITAIGHKIYVIGEAKDSATEEVRRTTEKYGDRDPLRLEIIAIAITIVLITAAVLIWLILSLTYARQSSYKTLNFY
jgi:hypothetical protein